MAVKLEKVTDPNQMLKVVVSIDSAIDWDRSMPDFEDTPEDEPEEDDDEGMEEEGEDNSLVARKQRAYRRDHDATKLVFKEGDEPTFFVFKHPRRAEVARKLRGLYGEMFSGGVGKKKKISNDMYSATFNAAYVGSHDGFEGAMQEAQRIHGNITNQYWQMLEDAGVVEELGTAYFKELGKRRQDNVNAKK